METTEPYEIFSASGLEVKGRTQCEHYENSENSGAEQYAPNIEFAVEITRQSTTENQEAVNQRSE